MNDAKIREIFLKNGFVIKEGQTDLKPYVYAAARELLSEAARHSTMPLTEVSAYTLPDQSVIQRAHQQDGPYKWAVRYLGNVMDHNGEFEYEPNPSDRDEAFIAKYRFATAQEAYDVWARHHTPEAPPNNVVQLHTWTTLSIPVADMLRNIAEDADITRVVVLAEWANGTRTYHSSDSDPAWAYLMAGRFMHKMTNGDFEQ